MTRHPSPARLTRRTALAHGTALGVALGLGSHAAAVQEATPAPPTIERHPDVVYGEAGGEDLLLDVRVPLDWPAPRPAVIVIHGGGLFFGSKEDAYVTGPAIELALVGYATFNVNYRLFNPDTGANPWPAQLDDVQRAVRWVRAHATEYGIDPDRVAAYGHSSGGTLATAVGVQETRDDNIPELAGISSRVNCVVDLSGDVDFTIPDPSMGEITVAMLGGTPEEQPAAYREASPLSHVDADSAPFLVMHGAQDTVSPVEHSRRLVEALHQAEVEVTYGEYPTAGHLEIADWTLNGPWTLVFLGQQPTRLPSGM